MGKVAKVLKKSEGANEGNAQKKISSFFTSGAVQKQSKLFSTVNQSTKVKQKLTVIKKQSKEPDISKRDGQISKEKGSSEDVIVLSDTPEKQVGKKLQLGKGCKSSSITDTSVSKNESFEKSIIDKQYERDFPPNIAEKFTLDGANANIENGDLITFVPETQEPCDISSPTFKGATSILDKFGKNAANKPTSTSQVYSEDIFNIPDTPDNSILDKSSSRKVIHRTFLSTSSMLTKPQLPKRNLRKNVLNSKKSSTGRSLEEALKDHSLIVDSSEKAQAHNTIMGEMGFSFQDHTGLISMQQESGLKQTNLTMQNSSIGKDTSGKRSSSKGISPNPKRLDRRTSGDKSRNHCKRNLDLDDSAVKNTREVPAVKKMNKKAALEEIELALKKKSESRKGRTVDLNESSADVLVDILNEMQTPEHTTVKKPTNLLKSKKSKSGNDSMMITTNGDVKQESAEYESVEKDDFLKDLIGEMQESQSSKIVQKAHNKMTTKSKSGKLTTKLGITREDSAYSSGTFEEEMDITDINTQIDLKKEVPRITPSQDIDDSTQVCTPKNDAKCRSQSIDLSESMSQLSPFKKRNQEESIKRPVFPPFCQQFGRYIVEEVESKNHELHLKLKSDSNEKQKTVILKGFWSDTHVSPGDTVNVIGDFNDENICEIGDKKNLIIVNPDLLVSGTTVVSSVHCMRKTVLNEKFKGSDGRNIYMLHGSIIHAFFQEVLEQKAYTSDAMRKVAEEILKQNKFLHEMYGHNATENSVMEEIEKYIPQMVKWIETYVDQGQFTFGQARPKAQTTRISGIADIEENIWSPRYGIKGKIDLTVEVTIHKERKRKLLPLELKTGRATYSVEHKGQVTLYSMMSGDRREDPGEGLLVYLKEGGMKSIPADHINKKGLIQLRNELAYYLEQSLNIGDEEAEWHLPKPLNNYKLCSKCPQLLNCTAFQKSLENYQPPEGHSMVGLTEESLFHLQPSHLEYYSSWVKMMHLELKHERKKGTLKEIWTKTSNQREKEGQCFSGMVLSQNKPQEKVSIDQSQYLQIFTKQHRQDSIPLTDIGPSKGDSVVISAENKPFIALCQGFIHDIDNLSVTVILDRDLNSNKDVKGLLFRLDKYDSFNSMGTNFTNISKLMENSQTCLNLRNLIIDKKEPEFIKTMPRTAIEGVKEIFQSLNKPQKVAILKVLMAKDYVLIKGYPGTGKTSTIVALVRILVAMGKSVLLASYTHSAVDNILLKLVKHKVDFLRIGKLSRIHQDIQPFSSEILTKNIKEVSKLSTFYQSKHVVATTCLGTSHVLFTQRRFDVCIVDEASQVLQPACMGPLFASRKFVLVGDPLQLPPVVQSTKAKDLGMAESLFSRLDDTGGTYELNLQYRMNKEIMRLSNELVYSGALKCGSTAVAEGRLQLEIENTDLWIRECLSPVPGREVVFLTLKEKVDEKDMKGSEKNHVQNQIEADLVLQLIQAAQLGPSDIGVIAPYRQQVKLLRNVLSQDGFEDIEVNTVDQYQGRDKSLIIMSFVKQYQTEPNTSSSGILNDIRRLNVALTRAKHKLILIGCPKALQQYQPIADVMKMLKPEQFIESPQSVC